ncbi:hypothetical protein [Burkholderia cepacia]|uniref:hypothetical protein n=1 Tax=Burkholderia cepacia TaxID=292 RepID=UPI00158A6142|nr:hypothetical protein [Burkholderia cepacia]
MRADMGRFQSPQTGTKTRRNTTQVDDNPASPCAEISFAGRASGTHNRCDVEVQHAPGAPPAATTAAGRLTKATRIAPRLTGALSHRITAARPAAGNASRFVTEK